MIDIRVSVIIPCYNGHKFLDQALESVRQQTCKPCEILVIDDGSTDFDTISYLESMTDDITLIRQENKGLPGARNTGFQKARGDYVLPLDCDDWLEPNFIEKGLELINSRPDIHFAFAWLKLEAESDGIMQKNYNFFEQLFLNQLPYCLLQPKSCWEELGGYDETMRKGYEDWDWNIRLGKAGYHGAVIPAPLFHYRVQKTGMLASTSRSRHAELWSFIRNKHTDLYQAKRLVNLWKQWRNKASTRPLWLYAGWELIYQILPVSVFNKLAASLFRFSASAKYSKTRRQFFPC